MAHDAHGFTLLELVITLIVASILLLTAVASFESWHAKQRMSAAMHGLHQDLLAARSQAIMSGIHAVACPGSVVHGCATDSNWSQGWIVFQDLDGDRELDATEQLLRQSPLKKRLNIMSSGHRRSFRFYPNGAAPGSNGSVWFCGSRGPDFGQRIVVSNTGRIRREEYPGLEWEDCPE